MSAETTKTIREGYTQWSITDEGALAAGEEFDAWLAEHDREVAATALEDYATERWGFYGFGEGRAMRARAEGLRNASLPTTPDGTPDLPTTEGQS